MELKEIYSKMKNLEELASLDSSIIEHRLRAGMEGKIRAAQSDLPKYVDMYKARVVQDSVIIQIKGKYGKEFAEISKAFKTLPIDFLKVIDDIGDSILKRGGKDRYTSHEHLMVMDELNKIKQNYKISQLPVFQAKFDGVGPDATLKTALLTQITNQYGNQLYSAVTRGEIGIQAMSVGFSGKRLPVVLYNSILPSDSYMLPSPVETITINEKPTKESVKEVLLSLKEKISSKAS